MHNIPETNASLGFSSDVYFERTGKIRERIIDCSREELIDLAFNYLGIIEKIHGMHENSVNEIENMLGYNEIMRPR